MKINNNTKYIPYIILFIIFILIRISYMLSSGEIENIGFKSLAISSCAWPFGIIKETALHDNSLPLYYLAFGFIKNEFILKTINILICLINVILFINIGKKLHNEKLGIFLGLMLSINHFYIYYTSLISSYSMIFLVQSLTINAILDYIKRPKKLNCRKLNILNSLLILCDTFGFVYVIIELFYLNLLNKKNKKYEEMNSRLYNCAFLYSLIVFPIILTQYIMQIKLVIPDNLDGIGLNIQSFYLMLSEYISPHLSFLTPELQAKSTLGLLYSYFVNPDIHNLNSLKILITLFYSSILPLILIILITIKVYLKNFRLKLIWLISATDLLFFLLLMFIGKISVEPIYSTSFFITGMILLCYGISSIKDNYIKYLIMACIVIIQFINPELNCFNITINKSYATIAPIKLYLKENNYTKNDIIIMPHMGKLGQKYFKKLNILDFEYRDLKYAFKNGFIKNLSNKKTNTINKKNIRYVIKDYLLEPDENEYITNYLIEKIFKNYPKNKKVLVIIDKLNSRPISESSIIKCAIQEKYSPKLRKIDFRYIDFNINQSKALSDAINSKTIYNFIKILNNNYKLSSITEYKKLDNEFYKTKTNLNKDIVSILTSYESDYVFIEFQAN